jgi:hypothetical protein
LVNPNCENDFNLNPGGGQVYRGIVFRSEIPTSEKIPLPSNPSYWIQKKAHRKTGYPLATIAYYGPDDTFASKVVAAIILSEKDDEVVSIEKWFSESLDVRRDPVIMNQILQFISILS